MPLLQRRRQLAMKIEATEGTAETLTAAEVDFDVEDLEANFTVDQQERNPLTSDLSPFANVPGMQTGEITGRTELKPGQNATTEPGFGPVLLRALGFAAGAVFETIDLTGAPTGTFIPGERITGGTAATGWFVELLPGNVLAYVIGSGGAFVAGESITGDLSAATATTDTPAGNTQLGYGYVPTTDGPSATAGVYEDGIRKLLVGSRGTGTLEVGGVGQLGYLNFTLSGKMPTPTDVALLAGVSIPTVIPETFLSAGVDADGDLLCIDTLSLDLANTVAMRMCANEATGVISARITERAPVLSVDPEKELEATIDFLTKYAAGTLFGFTAKIGSSAGKRTWIAAPRCQYIEMGNADRDGIDVYAAQLKLTRDQGDDELVLAFG